MSVSTAKMSTRQYLLLGDDPPGVRLELVNGEIAVSPSPSPEHSFTDTELRMLLRQHVKASDLGFIFGDLDTMFGEYDVRRPDIIYVSNARRKLISTKGIEGAPDLCVEIISPSSGDIDRRDKFRQYAKGGVAHYWIVDTKAQTIEAFRLSGGRYRAAGSGAKADVVRLPPFPDLEIPLSDLWYPLRRR